MWTNFRYFLTLFAVSKWIRWRRNFRTRRLYVRLFSLVSTIHVFLVYSQSIFDHMVYECSLKEWWIFQGSLTLTRPAFWRLDLAVFERRQTKRPKWKGCRNRRTLCRKSCHLLSMEQCDHNLERLEYLLTYWGIENWFLSADTYLNIKIMDNFNSNSLSA